MQKILPKAKWAHIATKPPTHCYCKKSCHANYIIGEVQSKWRFKSATIDCRLYRAYGATRDGTGTRITVEHREAYFFYASLIYFATKKATYIGISHKKTQTLNVMPCIVKPFYKVFNFLLKRLTQAQYTPFICL